MKKLFLLVFAAMVAGGVQAQRHTDNLDRGLVAVKSDGGIFCSWRIQAEEYYGVTYNLYRDGTQIATSLKTSNFTDAAGSVNSNYTVSAVVRGVEQPQSKAVKAFPTNSNYKEISFAHEGILSTLVPNDACCADVDGDGELDILMKFDNWSEYTQSYPRLGPTVNGVVTGEYSIFECLKMDGTRRWWVNCGPNMGDFQNNEQNIVAFDWDQDGKAEALMRAADGTTIHAADGQTYVIGDASKNYRAATGGGTNWFMHDGAEYLVYMNGETGVPYQIMEYPLKRLESGENDLERAWGDGYGHRSSKHFFGAPYLDGRKPSIFLGRGIYTRHKFVTFDVDPATHQLKERWRWTCNVPSSPWYGNGFHNYGIADVDMDGRDEIVFGSMTIDDNGMGLSTTGYGHGDAQHHGDFDPYTWGLEIFTCLEEGPVYGNALRDGTTGKVYYKYTATDDDGRAIMGNFSNQYPGAIGTSSRDPGVVGAVTKGIIPGATKNTMAQNFRIYWDGDLLEETFNYVDGKNTEGGIYKYNYGLIATLSGSMTNNDTKGTACYQGDLFGDWREEVIMRTADNKIRIYTTDIETPWRNYSLWYDHQYRNAMVWQMCGYNQPPHPSYFLGELENITVAPPSLTLRGRTEVANNGTVSNNGEEVIACETNDMTINIADGATPYLFIDNAPSWVQGSAPSEATAKEYKITYQYYTHTLQGGGFTGTTRVVKQGDGILTYPERDMTYSGETDIWAGTLNLNGSIANSPLWLNRHTTLNTPTGKTVTVKSLKADYGSTVNFGAADAVGTLTATDSVLLGFGARLKMDIFADGLKADQLNTAKLVVETQDWQYGPAYRQPVIEFVCHFADGAATMAAGRYVLGSVSEVKGSLSDIKIEGISKVKPTLAIEDGQLVLNIQGTRDAADIEWNATNSLVWDVANTENFVTHDPARAAETFIEGDNVYFTDDAQSNSVEIASGVEVKPTNIYYTGSESFTLGGSGTIASGTFHHTGMGTITMNGNHTYTGGNHLTAGTTVVSSLANETQEAGNLGGRTTTAAQFTIENSAVLQNTAAVTNGSPIRLVGSGIFKTDAVFTQQAVITGDTLVKTGSNRLAMTGTLSAARTVVTEGSMDYSGNSYNKVVELRGTSAISGTGFIASSLNIAQGAKASVTTVNRQTTSNNLTGTGQVTIYCATEKGSNYYATRTPLQLKMSNFQGTLVAGAVYTADGRFTLDTSTGSNKYTLNIPGGIIVQNSGRTLSIGKLVGTGTLGGYCSFSQGGSGTNTWNVGNDEDFTFNGVFTSGDAFNKVGTGTMTIGSAWTNTGAVRVNEGVLVAGQGKTLGTGALTIGANGTLQGLSSTIKVQSKNNPFTNSSVTVNGALRVGTAGTSTSGYWYLGTKPLTIGSTGTLYVGVAKTSTSANAPGCSHVWGDETSGSITFKDGATISVYLATSYDPASSIGTDEQKADSFFVFNFPKATVGEVNFDLPALPDHYYWDTTAFKSGYLYIRYTQESTGITAVKAVADPKNVYDLSGRLVRRMASATDTQGLPAGIYIRGGKKIVIK